MKRWSDVAERNRAMVAENAQRVLADTQYDRFRTPVALRVLVVAYVAATAFVATCWLLWGVVAGVASLAVSRCSCCCVLLCAAKPICPTRCSTSACGLSATAST